MIFYLLAIYNPKKQTQKYFLSSRHSPKFCIICPTYYATAQRFIKLDNIKCLSTIQSRYFTTNKNWTNFTSFYLLSVGDIWVNNKEQNKIPSKANRCHSGVNGTLDRQLSAMSTKAWGSKMSQQQLNRMSYLVRKIENDVIYHE